MDNLIPNPAPSQADLEKAAEAIYRVKLLKQQFIHCHEFLARSTYAMVELLREAESRGVLLEDAVTLVDAAHWLHVIDWQTRFLSMVLNFTKDPSRKTLRPLIELYGRDRERMQAEAEILERQLQYRLAHFAKPEDATVRKVILKNEQRTLAVYLHVRSGYRGVDLARFFKVPRTTAYGWLEWFKSLPEGLREGILAFMDAEAHSMAILQMPAVVAKRAAAAKEAKLEPGQPSPRGADMGSGSGPSGVEVPAVKSA